MNDELDLVAIRNGEQKQLRNANLYNANLHDANLRYADLYNANLYNADLCNANLYNANLRNANLYNANLRNANLHDVDLRNVDLHDANLYNADLHDANLYNADLCNANLYNANLRNADLSDEQINRRQVVPETGSFTAYKATQERIIKLRVPEDADRHTAIQSRKCRAECVDVVEVLDKNGGATDAAEGTGRHDSETVYREGETVYPDGYDPDPRVECSNGIHFFLTKQEAIDWL